MQGAGRGLRSAQESGKPGRLGNQWRAGQEFRPRLGWNAGFELHVDGAADAARQLEPRVRLAKIDTETEQALAARMGIRSIPTLLLFHAGREVARQTGAMSTADIVAWTRARL